MNKAAIRRINLMRFHNAVAIGKKIPVCRLEISRSGKFWQKIEKFLVSRRLVSYNCYMKIRLPIFVRLGAQ